MNLTDMFERFPRYALAAFNVYGYEDAMAVVRAAQSLEAPIILMVNRDAAVHMPLSVIGPLLAGLAQSASVPVGIHLDHATQLEAIREALQSGFTSVMFDGSQLPFDENVEYTVKTIGLARPLNISVEAEIGSVAYSTPGMNARHIYTDPEEAKAFYEAAPVDCLAVSVGTVHRMVAQTAQIQYDRLRAIRRLVSVPLVIHGSTGVSDRDLQALSREGVRKINIGTCLRLAFGTTLRSSLEENPEEFDRIRLFEKPELAVELAARDKILLLKNSHERPSRGFEGAEDPFIK